MSRFIRLRVTRVLGALAAAILIAAPGLVAQQGGTITGRVLDAQTGLPIGAVQVFIQNLDLGGLSQQSGRYLLQNIPTGTHELSAARIGYRTVVQQVTVGGGQVVEQNFTLTEEALALDEIIVTGTAGGTRRRALGNAVDRLNVAGVQEQIALPSVQAALTGRVPGLSFQRRTGAVGTGSRIQIRGTGSFNLSSNPLIYIDGVRVNNDVKSGPMTASSSGYTRENDDLGEGNSNPLDDLNMEEIESIEIIKGPAAATLYGTEASAGVIQIITKRGTEGAPVFDVSVSSGSNFFMDPAGKLGPSYTCRTSATAPCPAGDLIEYNFYDLENKYISGEVRGANGEHLQPGYPSERMYKNGRIGTYDVSVRGGTAAVRYYVSANYSEEEGVQAFNKDEKARLRTNLSLILAESLTLDVNASYIDGFTRYGDPVVGEGGGWKDLRAHDWRCMRGLEGVGFLDCPRTLGFYEQTALDGTKVEVTRDYSRFIGGTTLNHTVGDWLNQRFVLGLDKGWDTNERFFPRDPLPVFRETVQGTVDLARPVTTNLSVEYSANVTYNPNETWGLQTSFGAQYFTRSYEEIQLIGTDLASEFSRTINQTPVEKLVVNFTDIENNSVGFFVQEQVGWNDRIFITGAVRFDDNSAFGALRGGVDSPSDFDAQIYPKLSGTWVLSEESFWNVDFVNSLRVRSAWGKAGRQPNTFAGTNIYGTIAAPGGRSGIIPIAPGNQAVGPEVSTELEIGFDLAVLDDRVSTEFTWFSQQNQDALIDRILPPSVGFPGSVQQNIGRIDNWGWEAILNSRLYDSPGFSLDLHLNASHNDNEIKELGDLAPSRQTKVGFPFPNEVNRYTITSAAFGADGLLDRASVMCDSGVLIGDPSAPDLTRGLVQGGPSISCEDLGRQDILIGRKFHPYTFTVNPTVSLFEGSLQIFALAQGKHGGWLEDSLAPWQAWNGGSLAHWAADDPIFAAGRLNRGVYRDYLLDEVVRGAFWKMREIGVRWALPASVVARSGADRASLIFSGRELWTIWEQNPTTPIGVSIADPENFGARRDGNSAYYHTPPSSSVHVTLRVSF